MILVEQRDGLREYIPIKESVQPFHLKWKFSPDASLLSVVSDFRLAAMVAIAREDAALDQRGYNHGTIFLHAEIACTPLPVARAGAAVFYEAFTNYCAQKGLDPQETLVRNGTRPTDARMLLEYSETMHRLISEAEEK